MIKGLHHNAYRCRDSEETRRFYEDFLGLPLVQRAGDQRDQERPQDQHASYVLQDGRRIVPRLLRGARTCRSSSRSSTISTCTSRSRSPRDVLESMMAKGKAAGIETRGISDHQFIDSIYFRDPNGYVIELTAKRPGHDDAMDPAKSGARAQARSLASDQAARQGGLTG